MDDVGLRQVCSLLHQTDAQQQAAHWDVFVCTDPIKDRRVQKCLFFEDAEFHCATFCCDQASTPERSFCVILLNLNVHLQSQM